MDLTRAINQFLGTGGHITVCPSASACWDERLDPVFEFRNNGESQGSLIYIGKDIENVSNEFMMQRREKY